MNNDNNLNKKGKEQSTQHQSNVATLSEDELVILKASQDANVDRSTLPPHDNSDMAKAKRYIKKNIVGVVFTVLVALLVLVVITSLIIMLVNSISNAPSKDDFTVTLGDPKSSDGIEYTVPYKKAMIDDIFYLDVNKIADYAELVISGSQGRIKLSCPDGTYVRFEHGKATATVNGIRVHLGGEAKIIDATEKSDSQCWVPYSFIEKLFSLPTYNDIPGIRTIFSNKDNTVLIRKVTYSSGANEGKALPVSFSPDCFESAEDILMEAYKERYPEIASAATKNVMLVNKNNPLGESYVPGGLFSLNELGCPVVEGRTFELVPAAALSLSTMMHDMEKALGVKGSVLVTSAYRSFEYQEKLFSKYVSDLISTGYSPEEAVAEVLRTSANPGNSEHQSGLCIDLIEKGELTLEETFENCAAFKWLSQNAHLYGFILRYPKDKEAVTGYSYEPWHYRFVGIDAATVIYEDSLCLEEYLARY